MGNPQSPLGNKRKTTAELQLPCKINFWLSDMDRFQPQSMPTQHRNSGSKQVKPTTPVDRALFGRHPWLWSTGLCSQKLGINLLIPLMKCRSHPLHKFWMLIGDIIPFTNVLSQMILVLPPILVTLNQFPLPGPNSASRETTLITVMGIVPKE